MATQYSCLENPRDKGAWWAALYGVAQSRTRLKRLSSSSMVMLDNVPCVLEKISNTDKPLLRLTNKKREYINYSYQK